MKKIMFLLIGIMIIIPLSVKAETFTPSSIWTTYLPDSTGFHEFSPTNNGSYYIAYVPMHYDVYHINRLGFVYPNTTICNGGPFTLKGSMIGYAMGKSFTNAFVRMSIPDKDVICDVGFSDNDEIMSFSCSGSGVYNHRLQLFADGISNTPFMSGTIQYNMGISMNMDVNCDVTNDDVIAIQNQATQNIINSQNQNKEDIINNQDQNKQDIIDNQDKNNEELKDTINDNFNTCRDSKNLLNPSEIISGGYSIGNGNYFTSSTSFSTKNKINIDNSKNYYLSHNVLSKGQFYYVLYYDENENYLGNKSLSISSKSMNISNYEKYSQVKYINIRFDSPLSDMNAIQLEEGSSATSYEPYGEQICTNKMDETNNKLDETNGKLDDLNDNITNSDIDMGGANSFFGDFSDTDHGGISGVVTAPLRFINKLTATCNPLELDVLGSNVKLPCGNTLFWDKPEVANFRTIWNVLFGGAILYALMSKLFKVIEGLKNPDDSRIEVMKL